MTQHKRSLFEKMALAKEATTLYKTEYEEIKKRKEAKLKEKEEITVSHLCHLLSPSWLFSSSGPSSYSV